MQIQQTLKPRGSFGEIARYQRFVVASSVVLPVRAVSKLLICVVKRTHKAAPLTTRLQPTPHTAAFLMIKETYEKRLITVKY